MQFLFSKPNSMYIDPSRWNAVLLTTKIGLLGKSSLDYDYAEKKFREQKREEESGLAAASQERPGVGFRTLGYLDHGQKIKLPV